MLKPNLLLKGVIVIFYRFKLLFGWWVISVSSWLVARSFDQYQLDIESGIDQSVILANLAGHDSNNVAIVELLLNQKIHKPYLDLVKENWLGKQSRLLQKSHMDSGK